MADLFWPGDGRAGDHLTSPALLRAMVTVEEGWLDRLGRMAATLAAVGDRVAAEQRSMTTLTGREAATAYVGEAGARVDRVLERLEAR